MKRRNNKYPNLIPNSERTVEELREMGRKGGIKSGESRRRKKRFQKLVNQMFEADIQRVITGFEEVIGNKDIKQ